MRRNSKSNKRKAGSGARAPAEGREEELAEPSSPVCYLREFDDLSPCVLPVQIKRAYDPASPADGTRMLVDRLWPRGVSRPALAIDAWLKEVAPSTPLRQWFHRDSRKRWPEFQTRYRAELRSNAGALQPLYAAMRRGTLTLIYGARDTERNHAVVLREFLVKNFPSSGIQ